MLRVFDKRFKLDVNSTYYMQHFPFTEISESSLFPGSINQDFYLQTGVAISVYFQMLLSPCCRSKSLFFSINPQFIWKNTDLIKTIFHVNFISQK